MLITPSTKFILFKEKTFRITNILLFLLLLILGIEVVRDAFKTGDFQGYIEVGRLVLEQGDLYSYYGNTWPPFFSVFGVLIAWGAELFGDYGIRLLWEIGSVLACYWSIKLLYRMLLAKELHFNKHESKHLALQEPIVIVPLLLIFRFLLDNLANVQINTYLFLAVVYIMHLFFHQKYVWMGLLLAFTISLKVLPIFFLFYFIYKRKFNPAIWTIVFLLAINAISLVVFGIEQGLDYYKEWFTEVAPRGYMANHKNQSVFGAIMRFVTLDDPKHDMYVNFMSLSIDAAKKITYAIVAVIALVAAILFRKPIQDDRKFETLFEFAVICNAIPLLSPLSWKAYFLFMWPSIIIVYSLLYRVDNSLKNSSLKVYRFFFWLAVSLGILSSELFIGRTLAWKAEAWSAIAFGAAILLILQLVLASQLSKFKLSISQLKIHPKAKAEID